MTIQTNLISSAPGFKPFIEGTRITVQQVAEYHAYLDWTPERIAAAFRLTLAQVYAALSYYHEHKAEIDQAIGDDLAADRDLPTVEDLISGTLQLVMTPREIAQEFPVTEQAVYQAIRRSRLRARRSGKTWLIHRHDAEQLWGSRK